MQLVPSIFNQLGPDSSASLRDLTESYQSLQKDGEGEEGENEDDQIEIPEFVEGENFESETFRKRRRGRVRRRRIDGEEHVCDMRS